MESDRIESDDPEYDPMEVITEEDVKDISQTELKHMLKERAAKVYEAKESEFPEPEHMREIERVVLLKVIDAKWMDHIDDMDQLRQGIGLQAYGQRDPLVEYKMMGYRYVRRDDQFHRRDDDPYLIPYPDRAEGRKRAGGTGDQNKQR